MAPFEETQDALAKLAERFQLVILSNVQTKVLEASVALIGAEFSELITAEQLRSYKPRTAHFEEAVARVGSAERILHVAQSVYHDCRPAHGLGWATAWINREAEPLPEDFAPDLVQPDLSSLVQALA